MKNSWTPFPWIVVDALSDVACVQDPDQLRRQITYATLQQMHHSAAYGHYIAASTAACRQRYGHYIASCTADSAEARAEIDAAAKAIKVLNTRLQVGVAAEIAAAQRSLLVEAELTQQDEAEVEGPMAFSQGAKGPDAAVQQVEALAEGPVAVSQGAVESEIEAAVEAAGYAEAQLKAVMAGGNLNFQIAAEGAATPWSIVAAAVQIAAQADAMKGNLRFQAAAEGTPTPWSIAAAAEFIAGQADARAEQYDALAQEAGDVAKAADDIAKAAGAVLKRRRLEY